MITKLTEYEKLLEQVNKIAKRAGQEILAIYEKNHDVKYELKADDSPLTAADLLANDIITEELGRISADIPILSEEGGEISYEKRKKWQRYWLVDPLDGTNEFISRTGQFTVNIALIEDHQSVLGVSYAPALGASYFACRGKGAYKEKNNQVQVLQTKPISTVEPMKIIVSKKISVDKLKYFLASTNGYELIYYGGSLKICLVAEGTVDAYPRLGFNSEWDTAAGQCILEEAGGKMVDLDFNPLRYNTKDSLYNPYFLVIGDKNYNWQEYLHLLKRGV